jgi:hypothetical protein
MNPMSASRRLRARLSEAIQRMRHRLARRASNRRLEARASQPDGTMAVYRRPDRPRRRGSGSSRRDEGDLVLLAPVLYWVGLALVARADSLTALWAFGAGAPLLALLFSALRDRRAEELPARTSSTPPPGSLPPPDPARNEDRDTR